MESGSHCCRNYCEASFNIHNSFFDDALFGFTPSNNQSIKPFLSRANGAIRTLHNILPVFGSMTCSYLRCHSHFREGSCHFVAGFDYQLF